MSSPLFAFTAPRYAESKENRSKALRHDYSMLKLYPDGKFVYRYYKIEDPHPALQNRNFSLSQEELTAFLALLKEKKDLLLAYQSSHALPLEAKRLQHTLIHAFNHCFLIPDFIIDPRTSVYRERYAFYPDEETKAYYGSLFALVDLLHQDALAHNIYFSYLEHADNENLKPVKK